MNYKQIKLRPNRRYKGFDYRRALELEMSGKEWHQHAKVDTFRVAPDKDNRDAVGNQNEIWDARR